MRRSTTAADLQRAAQRKKLIILGVLALVLGAIWLKSLLTGEPTAVVAGPSKSAAVAPAKNVAASSGPTQDRQRVRVPVDWPVASKRNPFVFSDEGYEQVSVETKKIDLRYDLQGTLLGDDPRALINGTMLRVGEQIGTATLKHVGHGQVVLEVDGDEITVGQ